MRSTPAITTTTARNRTAQGAVKAIHCRTTPRRNSNCPEGGRRSDIRLHGRIQSGVRGEQARRLGLTAALFQKGFAQLRAQL